MLNYALAFLKAMSALTVLSSVACGQTYTFSVLYSVEWLVDESNVILIAEYADEVTDVKPKILRTLKGQQEVVQWPLTKAILRAGACNQTLRVGFVCCLSVVRLSCYSRSN